MKAIGVLFAFVIGCGMGGCAGCITGAVTQSQGNQVVGMIFMFGIMGGVGLASLVGKNG